MPQTAPQPRERLNTYVEPELAAWVRRTANHQGYTTSSFLRRVLVQLREEMLPRKANTGTVAGVTPYPPEEWRKNV